MRLYIAQATCSRAPQTVINEVGLAVELVLYDVPSRTTANGEDFAAVNRFRYVPVLELDHPRGERLTEANVIAVHLADLHPDHHLMPAVGTLARVRAEQTLTFIATEIAQKHIPLMRGHMNDEGQRWTRERLVEAYALFDSRLADGRPWLDGEGFSVLDIYLWATMWQDRTGVQIDHLAHLAAWTARMALRPAVQQTLADEARLVAAHAAQRTG